MKETKQEKDKCIICSKETPYLMTTHIDYRVGYLEGSGQGCFQPQTCNSKKVYQPIKNKKND